MDILKGLVDEKPDFVEAHYHLGMAFLNKQRPADALAELTTASEKFKAQEQTIMLTAPQLKAQIAEGLKRAQEQGGAKTDAK
jgi:cytosine/adenosine deaminase-related metal-dependent hydrolase